MQIPGYRIERELGQGGMAIVYLAVQESLHRKVALKVIRPALTMDEEFAQRFMREGRTIAQLSDPHIVTVYDISSHQGTYYLSMEYLPGGTLQQRIAHGLNVNEVLTIAKAVVSALNYAHQHQVIHRDIKPQNILFRDNGQAVLTDFGIAKTLGATTIMTRTGLSLGTPRYMSPEQIRGQGVDARSDLYSFGVMLYEMLTGNVPYNADDSFALAMMHVTAPVPALPPQLQRFQALLDTLLDKNPARRLQSGAEIIAALDASEAGKFQPPARVSATSATSKQRIWRMGAALALVAGSALGASYWLLWREATPVPPLVEITPPTAETTLPAQITTATPTATSEEQQQAQMQAEQSLEQARLAQQGGSAQMALVHVEQGLQAQPNHAQLLHLKQTLLQERAAAQQQEQRQQAAAQQAAAEQAAQKAAAEAAQQAEERRRTKEALAQREFEAMQRARDAALQKQAEAEQRQRVELERRQRSANELFAKALEEQRNHAYETSLLRIEQGLRQVPNHAQLLALRQQVRSQLNSASAPPEPVNAEARIAALLQQCTKHAQDKRFTSGKGGNAADCYRSVLRQDSDNAAAHAGLEQIADYYAQLADSAIQRRDKKVARNALSSLEKLNPGYAQLAELRAQLAELNTPQPKIKDAPLVVETTAPPVAVPPINLVSTAQPAESTAAKIEPKSSSATHAETQILAQDRHTRISQTKTNENVSLQITTSEQGMLDASGRSAVKKAAPANIPAQLKVRSDVEDAEVLVNNRKIGTTPLQVELPPGTYRVRVRMEGYNDWNGKVDLAPGDESTISAILPQKIAKTAPLVEESKPAPLDIEEAESKPRAAQEKAPPAKAAPRQSPNCLSGDCVNGSGTYHYPDGSQYSGAFRNAKMHGQGTYTYAGRGEKYVGEWRNGVINGSGAYYYRTGNRYEGQWRNGRKSGQGTYLYADRGEKYVGQFANDQPHGQGTYYYSDGDRYEGEWRNGRKHGHGVLYEDGKRIVGEWQNDQKVSVQAEPADASNAAEPY